MQNRVVENKTGTKRKNLLRISSKNLNNSRIHNNNKIIVIIIKMVVNNNSKLFNSNR